MNRTAHEVQTRWFESRQPEDRTGNEAEKSRSNHPLKIIVIISSPF